MVKAKTFDLLDSHFNSELTNFYSIPDKDRWDNTRVEFHLDAQYWSEYYKLISSYKFDWKEFKFSDNPDLNALIPSDDIGIYLFIVKSHNLIYDLPKYVFYVGISGEDDSDRPLKERLNDYFNLGNIKKRSKLERLMNRYYKNLYVVFNVFDKSDINSAQLMELEENLHGFFLPPANDRDFPVRIKTIIKAQFTR